MYNQQGAYQGYPYGQANYAESSGTSQQALDPQQQQQQQWPSNYVPSAQPGQPPQHAYPQGPPDWYLPPDHPGAPGSSPNVDAFPMRAMRMAGHPLAPPPGQAQANPLLTSGRAPHLGQYAPSPQAGWYQEDMRGESPLSGPSRLLPAQPGRGESERSDGVDGRIDRAERTGSQKKKRRKTMDAIETEGSPDDGKEKRTKTGRACDACRSKKIRCDILAPIEVPGGEAKPICAHCKQYDLECTFFLPITETRFKKRRAREEPSILNPLATGSGSPGVESARPAEIPSRVEGPTSLSFLLHTSLPVGAADAYDLREHSKWEILDDGNGLIRVTAPPDTSGYADADRDDPTKAHNRLTRPVLSAQTISLLVNEYFDHVAPLFPIISKSDFASKLKPGPLLLYAICGLGATRRKFPREVFAGVRGVINGLLRSNDILSDARMENVQALLLLSQVGDLHAQPTAATASAALIRMGTAVRMAQDLGLHRESTLRAQTAQDLAYIEVRRRVWATCVILDRWYGAALGVPLLIDVLDCDVLIPATYDIIPDQDSASWPSEPSFVALTEHLKLSILMGRVLKTIYSPTGLKQATDEQLNSLLDDMTAWFDDLPEELRLRGPESSIISGLLHMGYAALQFLFWRVFMRIQYTCPPHLTFRLRGPYWTNLVDWSRQAIQWMAQNNEALDTLFVFPYAATSCALVQYHTWARRRDEAALESLALVRDTAIKWEQTVQPDQQSIRRKTCETMTLLHEAALKHNPNTFDDQQDRPAALNPTAGVQPRIDVGKAIWFKSSGSSPGYWLAWNEKDRENAGLTVSDVKVLDELEGDERQEAETALLANQKRAEALIQEEKDHIADRGLRSDPILKDLQISGQNVNPQMNSTVEAAMAAQGTGDPATRSAEHVAPVSFDFAGNPVPQPEASGTSNMDFSMLDDLPLNGVDFGLWESYFGHTSNSFPPTNHMSGRDKSEQGPQMGVKPPGTE